MTILLVALSRRYIGHLDCVMRFASQPLKSVETPPGHQATVIFNPILYNHLPWRDSIYTRGKTATRVLLKASRLSHLTTHNVSGHNIAAWRLSRIKARRELLYCSNSHLFHLFLFCRTTLSWTAAFISRHK